jgi:S1-C subfamily serine protease
MEYEMRRKSRYLLILFVSVLLSSCTQQGFIAPLKNQKKSPEELALLLRKSTVKIFCNFEESDLFDNDKIGMSGSGVIIDKKGGQYEILTNLHNLGLEQILESDSSTPEIIKYSVKIVFYDTSRPYLPTKIRINSKLKDFALIYVSADNDYPKLPLSRKEVVQGTKVYAMGHPTNLDYTFTSGVISGFRSKRSIKGAPVNILQTDAAINPGNSGGPLIDDYGNLLGINTIKVGGEGLSFTIESGDILKAIYSDEFIDFPFKSEELGQFVENLYE